MDTKQKFRLGLQWGALGWLGYITYQSWNAAVLMVFPWILACVLLAVGWRGARLMIAVSILGQLAFGMHEAVRLYTPEFCAAIGVSSTVRSVLHTSGIALCLGLVPLVAWRVEGPRITVALLAMGRWRDAWARSGGAVALLAAVPVVALNRAALNLFMENEIGLFGLVAAAFVLARYGEVIVTLPSKGRQVG